MASKTYDPDLQKQVEQASERFAGKREPAFYEHRRSFIEQLNKDRSRFHTANPYSVIRSANTFEELTAIGQTLHEDYGRDDAFWKFYNVRRLELAQVTSMVAEDKFAIPIDPVMYDRDSRAGLVGKAYQRNMLGQTFTRAQMMGEAPVQIERTGVKFTGSPLSFKQAPKSFYMFDIETTGLLKDMTSNEVGSRISPLSLASMTEKGKSGHMFLADMPKNTDGLSERIITEFLPRHKQVLATAKGNIARHASEVDMLQGFMKGIQSKHAIMGYNIKQFDLPFMEMLSQRHGMHSQFLESIKGKEVIDVADYAKAFLSEKLGDRFVGWQASSIEGLGMTPRGWKLSAVAAGFGLKTSGAHQAHEDVEMTSKVFKMITGNKKWSEKRYFEALKELGQELTPLSAVDKYTTTREGQTFLNLPEQLRPKAAQPLSLIERIPEGSRPPIVANAEPTKPSLFKRGISWAGANKGKIAIGLGLAAIGGLAFSAKDDNYNTIEALKHGGMSEGIRRSHTDFGSGWRGNPPPSELMGIQLDPEVVEYRQNFFKTKEYWAMKAEMEEAQKEAQSKLGDFRESDYVAKTNTKADYFQGINYRNPGLREVNLSNYKVHVEDADTIILKRRGLLGFLSKDIQVRLAGIDAPETAEHADDAMAPVRYEQDQPYGTEAAEGFKRLVEEQDSLSLLVGTEKTYGRYVGALLGDNSVLNIEAARRGLATALPFGEVEKDVVTRGAVEDAQRVAQAQNAGVWQLARYKAIDRVQDTIGQPITHNTITQIDKLAGNLNLAAYSSLLEGMGSEKRELTAEEQRLAEKVGYVLRKTHGPKKRAYNKSDGLHPGANNSMGAWSVRSHSDFGSGWDALRALAKTLYGETDDAFGILTRSPQFKEAIRIGLTKQGKMIGEGKEAIAFSHSGVLNINGQSHEFDFVAKKFHEMASRTSGGYQAERSALEELGHLRAPSLYGTGEEYGLKNTVLMEKFNNVRAVANTKTNIRTPLTKGEADRTEAFIRYAHSRDITHSDLHGENVVRVTTPQGADEIGVLDWGASGYFGEDAFYPSITSEMKAISKEVTGREASVREFMNSADITRIRALGDEKYSRIKNSAVNDLQFASLGRRRMEKMFAVPNPTANGRTPLMSSVEEFKSSIPWSMEFEASEARKKMSVRAVFSGGIDPNEGPNKALLEIGTNYGETARSPVLESVAVGADSTPKLSDIKRATPSPASDEVLTPPTRGRVQVQQVEKIEVPTTGIRPEAQIEAIHAGADKAAIGAQAIAQNTKGQFKSGWTGVILHEEAQQQMAQYGYDSYREYRAWRTGIADDKVRRALGRKPINGIEEGLHPGSPGGLGAKSIQAISDFGSAINHIKRLLSGSGLVAKRISEKVLSPIRNEFNYIRSIPTQSSDIGGGGLLTKIGTYLGQGLDNRISSIKHGIEDRFTNNIGRKLAGRLKKGASIESIINESGYKVFGKSQSDVEEYAFNILSKKGIGNTVEETRKWHGWEHTIASLTGKTSPVASHKGKGILEGTDDYYREKAESIIRSSNSLSNKEVDDVAKKYKELTLMHEFLELETMKKNILRYGSDTGMADFGSHASEWVIKGEIEASKAMGKDYFEIMRTARMIEVSGGEGVENISFMQKELLKKSNIDKVTKEVKETRKIVERMSDDGPELEMYREQLAAREGRYYMTKTSQLYNKAQDGIHPGATSSVGVESIKKTTQDVFKSGWSGKLNTTLNKGKGLSSKAKETFRHRSRSSVGLPIQSAHNAGKGHRGFRSNKPLNNASK